MIKSFEKLKVRIDQNLNRAEKSEALNEDVVKVENKVACLKQVGKGAHYKVILIGNHFLCLWIRA